MHAQTLPETDDLFPELIPTKPFGLTFSPVEFVGPYVIDKKELGFFRLLSSTGRIIANVRERIPLVTLRILSNAWDTLKTVEHVQNNLQTIFSDMECGRIQTYRDAVGVINPLALLIQQARRKVVVSEFPNGGADSITKPYDLSGFEGPFQEVESGGGMVEITSSKGIGIAFVSDLIPISVRQTLLNAWDNFNALENIEERLLSILSDLDVTNPTAALPIDELNC